MIVRQFLLWVQTAAPAKRAEATSALARAYLYSDLTPDDRLAAEAAMTVLLDDPSPMVRRSLADALASSHEAPHNVIIALANDQPEIAEFVAARSPLLSDAELVDLCAGAHERVQSAIASRINLSRAVAGAIAEVGGPTACLTLIENFTVEFPQLSLARIAERHGHLAAVREGLLAHDGITVEIRQSLVAKLSETLARFVAHKEWMPEDRAQRVTREACDRATVEIAAGSQQDEVGALVRHLMQSEQLTGTLLLRALLSNNMRFVIEAFAGLSGLGAQRVASILSDRTGQGFRALYDSTGLPASAYHAFRSALEVIHETGFAGGSYGAALLGRRMVERVLTRYEGAPQGEIDYLLAMLRRFAAEAAREEARYYTADLIAAA
jgi:uncharacterized protein (DUF2336 family)